jgi:hypothetical protein
MMHRAESKGPGAEKLKADWHWIKGEPPRAEYMNSKAGMRKKEESEKLKARS